MFENDRYSVRPGISREEVVWLVWTWSFDIFPKFDVRACIFCSCVNKKSLACSYVRMNVCAFCNQKLLCTRVKCRILLAIFVL